MLIVDILHEFELGVWKALFIHLLRILNSLDKTLVNELDRRYVKSAAYTILDESYTYTKSSKFASFRQVPTFGRDTIRRFSSNISELRRLAARDFEDILQVGNVHNSSI